MFIPIPNKVTDRNEDFYISFNNRDSLLYGCDTTALVLGAMESFYILNGNHTTAYSKLPDLNACLAYFKQNAILINKFSDKVE